MSDREDPGEDTFRLLGRMTAGVAHDLSNYLAALQVSLDLLEQRGADPLHWRWAQEAMDSAIQLSRNLLEYARGGTPEPQPVQLATLVRRMLDLVGRLIAPEVLVVLDEGPPEALPPVPGVASELEQLVLNLVLNACDAMPGGGELRIRLRAEGPSAVLLEVLDTGAGLRHELTRGAVTPSTKPGRHGRGLGLGIVRSVVERHAATLAITAREAGGTAVSVTFPVEDQRRTASTAAPRGDRR